jgi:hypothetical protein
MTLHKKNQLKFAVEFKNATNISASKNPDELLINFWGAQELRDTSN